MSKLPPFQNPFRPGAGQMPPYLAGRETESREFKRLLQQEVILENLVLTGLRGVGKTVLLETLKPIALRDRWLWAGADLSESASVSEERFAIRLLADLSLISSNVRFEEERPVAGFTGKVNEKRTYNYDTLVELYQSTPGLVTDKLKRVIETVWGALDSMGVFKGLIFAYDEAQNLDDHAARDQFPLSTLLDLFQSLQKKNYPIMIVLVGLPTLFPKLVDARTFAERMFRVVELKRLDRRDTLDAILKPIQDSKCPISFTEDEVEMIWQESGGYPYFIQFICREAYDYFLQKAAVGQQPAVPINAIIRKLDSDFFAGRWARASDRQRELLSVVARVEDCDREFSVQEIVEKSRELLQKPFGSSHVNQMLAALSKTGLIYKNRHGRYSFAVPFLGNFIKRQTQELDPSH